MIYVCIINLKTTILLCRSSVKYIFISGNKKYLETDEPQGKSMGVFSRFHFGLGAKNRPKSFRGCILPYPELPKIPVLSLCISPTTLVGCKRRG